MNTFFHRFSRLIAGYAGSPNAFIVAVFAILVWVVSGPWFRFSDTWQLVINTTTTIVTFLMVFLLQNTQNRDTKVIQLKLDELIRAVEGARNQLVNLENLKDEELEELEKQFVGIREECIKRNMKKRAKDLSEG